MTKQMMLSAGELDIDHEPCFSLSPIIMYVALSFSFLRSIVHK